MVYSLPYKVYLPLGTRLDAALWYYSLNGFKGQSAPDPCPGWAKGRKPRMEQMFSALPAGLTAPAQAVISSY